MNDKQFEGYKTHTDMHSFHSKANQYAYERLKREQEIVELKLKLLTSFKAEWN